MDQKTLSIVPEVSRLLHCGKCGAFKSPLLFYTHGNRAGRAGWCKECRKLDEKKRRTTPRLIEHYRFKYSNDLVFRSREVHRCIQKRAKRIGVEFDLDLPWFESRFRAGVCEVSGLAFDFSHGRNAFGPSVDRIKCGGGYTKRNSRMVLHAVNTALMDWGMDQFIEIAHAVAQRYPVTRTNVTSDGGAP